jgi:hypothetical protein
MTDLLRKGSDWLERMQAKHASQEVVYCRASSSTAVPAILGKSEFDVDDGAGSLVRYESRDFLILKEDLKLDEIRIEPLPGDRIVSECQQFEVMQIPGQPCWRWSDAYRRRFRIHTKFVGDLP